MQLFFAFLAGMIVGMFVTFGIIFAFILKQVDFG